MPGPTTSARSSGVALRAALWRRRGAVGAASLVAVPALADLLSDVHGAPFRWLAADAFYYLTIGRNVARTGRFAFDGARATNGFHPLWQVCVAALEGLRLGARLGDVGPLLVVLASLTAVSAGAWVLAATLALHRRGSPFVPLLAIGVYPVVVLPVWLLGLDFASSAGRGEWLLPLFGTPWSYANGMESGVTILFFALSLQLTTAATGRSSARRAACAGGALAGLTLARLDHGLIAAAMLAGFVVRCLRAGRRASAAAGTAAFGALLAPYLALNRVAFGGFMPTSGAAKTTFPHLCADHFAMTARLLRGYLYGTGLWLPVACREVQIVVPALLALAYLAWRALGRRRATDLEEMLAWAAAGALALAVYNFAFVRFNGEGFWYFPVSTLLPTLFVASARGRRAWPTRQVRGLVVAVPVVTVAFFCAFQRHPTYNRDLATFFTRTAGEVRAAYPGGVPPFVEADDGIVSYALDTPAESIVLALDPEGYRARTEQRLATLSSARGFHHVATSAYAPSRTGPTATREWTAAMLGQPMDAYDVTQEYASPDRLFVLVRFDAR